MKAIETQYRGYRFRSRVEARWAVFFDALEVEFEYENQGFDLDGAGLYLPDFWLPQHGYWVEIKGQEPTSEEREKARALLRHTGQPVLLFVGEPALERGEVFLNDVTESSGGASDWNKARWFICPTCRRPDVSLCDARADRQVMDANWHALACCWNDHLSPLLKAAVLSGPTSTLVHAAAEAARGARFEHGESGAVRLPKGNREPVDMGEMLKDWTPPDRAQVLLPIWRGNALQALAAMSAQGARLTDMGLGIELSGVVTDEMRAVVREHRSELLRELRKHGGAWPVVRVSGHPGGEG